MGGGGVPRWKTGQDMYGTDKPEQKNFFFPVLINHLLLF